MCSEGLRERYVNPYTDFAFKLLFGTDLNKEVLIGFLNALFNGEQVIEDVTYLNTEHLAAGNPNAVPSSMSIARTRKERKS